MVLGGISQAASVAESASRVGITTRRAGASSGRHGSGRGVGRAFAAATLAGIVGLGQVPDVVAGDPGASMGAQTEQASPSHTAEALRGLSQYLQADAARAEREAEAADKRIRKLDESLRQLDEELKKRGLLIVDALD